MQMEYYTSKHDFFEMFEADTFDKEVKSKRLFEGFADSELAAMFISDKKGEGGWDCCRRV